MMKILLLDDHQLFREGLALLLHRLAADLHLLQAATCDEAFALCEAQRDIELILLDLNLVGMRGLDGLGVLRARYPQMPFVVVSSSDDPSTVRQAIDAGAMGFIPKSSSSEILLNALRLVLAKGIYLPPSVLLAEPPPLPLARPPMSPAASAARAGAGALTPVSGAAGQVDQAHLPRARSRRRHRQGPCVGRVARPQRDDAHAGRRRRTPAGAAVRRPGRAVGAQAGRALRLTMASARRWRSVSGCTGLGSSATPSWRMPASAAALHSPVTIRAGMSSASAARIA